MFDGDQAVRVFVLQRPGLAQASRYLLFPLFVRLRRRELKFEGFRASLFSYVNARRKTPIVVWVETMFSASGQGVGLGS